MTRPYKIATLIIFTVVVIPLILIGSRAARIKQYRNGFSLIEMRQSKESVINSMGKASEIRSCSFPIYNENKNHIADCFEIFTYDGVYERWAIAFAENGNVVEKYYWFLGEYGKRPSDLN